MTRWRQMTRGTRARPGSAPPRTRRRPSPRRQRIGGVAVLLVLALAVYAVFVRTLPWSSPWTVRAVFSNSSQITPGSPVRIAGIDVGNVTAVGRGPGTTALVTMSVDATGRPIHADATATIRPRLFLEGSYYVDLHPGSPSGPDLASGSTLPLAQTAVPVSFSTVLSTLDAATRQNLINIIDGFSHGLAHGGAADLRSDVQILGPTLKHSALAAESLIGTGPDDVTHLIEGADRVTHALSARINALTAGIDAEAALAGTLADQHSALAATVNQLDATLISAPASLTEISRALTPLRSFAGRLLPSLTVAPSALTGTAALLSQVRALTAAGQLPRLLPTLGSLGGQVSELEPKLEDLFPRVREITSCTANQVVTLLDTKLQDGALSTGQPVWQELAHVNVGLASATEDFDAAGTRVRFATAVQPNLLALGSVPGVGALLENTERPLLGIRPQWTGPTPPPVEPGVPCTTQPLGNLQAAANAMPASQTRATIDWAALAGDMAGQYRRAERSWSR